MQGMKAEVSASRGKNPVVLLVKGSPWSVYLQRSLTTWLCTHKRDKTQIKEQLIKLEAGEDRTSCDDKW